MGGLESDILSFVKHFLGTVSYPGIFLLMAIEGFGVPIPSEITMPFSGFLSTSAQGNKFILPLAIAIGALGEITGGVLSYWLGFAGGRRVMERYGRLVLVSEEELEKAEVWFRKYGDWVVLVTRLLPAIRSFIALPAGVVRMPFWRFLAYSTVGSAVWCTALGIVGYVLGNKWDQVSGDLRKYDVIILIVLAALVAFAVYKRLQGIRRNRDQTATAD